MVFPQAFRADRTVERGVIGIAGHISSVLLQRLVRCMCLGSHYLYRLQQRVYRRVLVVRHPTLLHRSAYLSLHRSFSPAVKYVLRGTLVILKRRGLLRTFDNEAIAKVGCG